VALSRALIAAGKVRFLDQVEESRLRNALMERDVDMQSLRTVANDRRQKRPSRCCRRCCTLAIT
jgi:hypothetical protein